MLASLLAASPCALTVADAAAPDQPALFVNAVWQRRTGYGSAEVLGRNLRFLQAPPGARGRARWMRGSPHRYCSRLACQPTAVGGKGLSCSAQWLGSASCTVRASEVAMAWLEWRAFRSLPTGFHDFTTTPDWRVLLYVSKFTIPWLAGSSMAVVA